MFSKMSLTTAVIIACLVAASAFAGEITKVSIGEAQLREKLPDENNLTYDGPIIPLDPQDIADSPGEMVGRTYYDYQTNGSTGYRIMKHECGTHIAWMRGIRDHTGERIIFYNYIDPNGNLGFGNDGTPVSSGARDGFTNISVKSDDGVALVAYHDAVVNRVHMAADALCGAGLFTIQDIPNSQPGDFELVWPYITYDMAGRAHITVTEISGLGEEQTTAHTYSEDAGNTWSELIPYDTLMDVSGIVVSSPIDNKVAIVYTKPINDGTDPNQFNNDVVYIESLDGETWDYGNQVNITNYAWEDTIRAYTDVAACYDYCGNLHIVWNAPYYNAEEGTISDDACLLFHWSDITGIDLIFDAWHASYPGAWNRSASKMSISCAVEGCLYVLWTHFDDFDISTGLYSNGELYLSGSKDCGSTWSEPINITNTAAPGCAPGDCDSEHWSALAPQVDDSLYITFIEDKDAGGIPHGEGFSTENPVRYLSVPATLYDCDCGSGVDDSTAIPSVFALRQNYPNPFNASTNIEFVLERNADVELSIYNVLGEKMGDLVKERLSIGEHTFKWNGEQYASGIYFYKLSVDGKNAVRRMVLLK